MRRIRWRGKLHGAGSAGAGWRAALIGALAVLLVLALVAPAGAAIGRGKGKKKPAADPRPPHFDRLPPMVFLAGELQGDGRGGWVLSGTPLAFGPDSILDNTEPERGDARLRDGDRAMLMGHWSGGVFVVRHGLLESAFARAPENERPIRAIDPRSEEGRHIPQ